MNWELKRLDECCISIADGDHLPPPKSDEGIPFITISNVTDNHIDFSNTMYVPQDYYDKLDPKRKAKAGDVLYSVVGSFGIPVYIKEDIPFVFQRHIAILRPNSQIVPRFLYYTMLSKAFYIQADSYAIGAAQRTISLTSLRKMKIKLPPISVQEKIVSVLSAYDNLIENNSQRIKVLEKMAENIFKEWFVRFRFSKTNSVKVKNGIPRGWKIAKLKDISDFSYGKMPDTSLVSDEGYPVFSGYRVSGYYPEYMYEDEMLILIARGVGGTGDIKFSPPKSYITNLSIVFLLRDTIYKSYLYQTYHLKNLRYLDTGAAQSQITIENLKNAKIVIPPKPLLKEFNLQYESIKNEIEVLKQQNVNLAKQRDLLLPRLLSSKLEV